LSMVFHHHCIPLNVNLRRERQRNDEKIDTDQEFRELLAASSLALKTGDPQRKVVWSHSYTSLFTHRFHGRTLSFHEPKTIMSILATRTYWYPRLKSNMKLMVKHLVHGNKLLTLKEILHVADGIICQLLVSFPEILMVESGSGSAYAVTDRISNSIISSCLLNYAKVVKEVKAFRKTLRMAAFEKRELPLQGYRHMSWVVPIIREYNRIAQRNSREKMFRVCTFTQTRATGLANHKMVEDTLSEFITQVTTPKEFTPDSVLLEAIDEVTTDVVFDADGISPHFRASMSTSACIESSRKKDGKFGHLRDLVRANTLPIPEVPSPDSLGGEIGTPLWFKAFRMAKERHTDLWKVNVTGIRENGKCRVVTSGSFYKDVLLQPFSHLTIEMAKSDPLLQQSFQAARLGWEFIGQINNLDPVRGEILFEDDVSILSFDFKKATDAPTHASGRAVMGPLLRKSGLDEEIIQILLDVWVGDKNLYRNGEHIGVMVNGIPMGDPLTKTNLSLVHPICSRYAKKKIGRRIVTIGAGNGDDGVQAAAGPYRQEYFSHFLEAARQLGYERSIEDTFITEDWATYCEEVFRIPIDRFHITQNAVRLKDSRISPYLDLPKGRLIIDTRKDRKDHSSDPRGKYTLLGKDMEYVSKDSGTGINFLFSISSACQDICLGLRDRPEPVSLPRQIFGIGKPPSNWNVATWFNQIISQRPWARYLTVHVMMESIGWRPPHYTTLRGVMREQPHFKDESILEVLTIPEDDPIKQHRVIKGTDWNKFPDGVLDKLISGGVLVRESKLSSHYLFHKRMSGILSEQVDLFEVARTMTKEIEEFDEKTILSVLKEFIKQFKHRPWTLRNVMCEDLYSSKIIGVMAQADPLRVDLDYNYLKRFRRKPRPNCPYTRSMQELETWFDDNYENILSDKDYSLPPRAILADDDIICLEIERNPEKVILLVTDDRRLARRAAWANVDKLIMRCSCRDWVFHSADATRFEDEISKLVIERPKTIIDFGSLDTFMNTTGATYSYGIPHTDPLIREWSGDVPRRTPQQQARIYSRFRVRPPITLQLVSDIIEVMTHRDAQSFRKLRVSTLVL